MKTKLTLLLCSICCVLLAETVFDSNTTPSPFYLQSEERPSDMDLRGAITFSNGLGQVPGHFCVFSKPFEVDFQHTYKISGEFRILDAQGPISNFHFALQPRDAQGGAIFVHEVFIADENIGTLSEDALDGDTEIFLEANDWKIICGHWNLAFNAEEDLSDLPNRNCSPRIVQGSETIQGNCLRLTLGSPLKGSYPAGSKVRLHSDGPTYLYAGKGSQPGREWTKWIGTISGMNKPGTIGGNHWYQGTTHANVIFRCFDPELLGGTFQFRNIKVEKQ